jgi:hypothetical protein
MAGWRRAVELAMTDEEIERLTAPSRSRTESASRVLRAQMLLAYRENPSFCAVGQRVGVHHQTVQRCVERALGYGPLVAIEDRPRPGKEPVITPEAKAWLVSLACDKAKEHGYPHELWGPSCPAAPRRRRTSLPRPSDRENGSPAARSRVCRTPEGRRPEAVSPGPENVHVVRHGLGSDAQITCQRCDRENDVFVERFSLRQARMVKSP